MKAIPKTLKEPLKYCDKLLDLLFDKQLEFIKDTSMFKVACCGRRAGKSFSIAVDLYHKAMSTPDCICVYLGLTRSSAKKIMWRILKRIARENAIEVVWEETPLIAHFPNGSEIWVMGANDESTAETLRGNAFKLVTFDECSSWSGHLSQTIDEIVVPAIMDNGGQIILIGTPSTDFKSLFYQATHKLPEYEKSRYHWTCLDNPHMQGADYIKKLKKVKKWKADNPVLLREYMGLWVRTDSDLVYHYNPARNSLGALPNFDLIKIMGVDVGFIDADAIEILGYNPDFSDKIYRIHGIKTKKQGIHALAMTIQAMRDKYGIAEIVMDEGGLGKKIGEELRVRYSLPVQAADKTQKLANIEFLNCDLESGNILVPEDSVIAEEWLNLSWSDESRTKEDRYSENHSSDAFLYAYKKCRAYLYKEPVASCVFNSDEYWTQQEEWMLNECKDKLNNTEETNEFDSIFDPQSF